MAKKKLVRCTKADDPRCVQCGHDIEHERMVVGGPGPNIVCTLAGDCEDVAARVRCVRVKEKADG